MYLFEEFFHVLYHCVEFEVLVVFLDEKNKSKATGSGVKQVQGSLI